MSKVSILLPTRNRFEMFKTSVESLFENCDKVDQFEILVALDNDDVETSKKIEEYSSDKSNIRIFYYERYFYKGLQKYYNDLSNKALGTSLFLWNDDLLMKSKSWDTEVLNNQKEFCVLSPMVDTMETYWREQGVLFPILPKKWIEVTGEWSPLPACDSWIDVLSKRLNLLKKLESVVVSHVRHDVTGENNDQTYIEGRVDLGSSEYDHLNDLNVVEEHYQKLYNYLNEI